MAQQENQTDLSFLDKKDPDALSAKDIIFTVIRNIHWLLLFALVGGGIAWFRADRATRTYESHAQIKIYNERRGALDGVNSILDPISGNRRRVTMSSQNALNDEIIIIKSESAMMEVARRLHLDMTYQYKTKLVRRIKDLYRDSPIAVELPDLNERDYARFSVTLHPDSLFTVSVADQAPVEGHLGDTVSTGLGRVIVHPTWALRELYYDYPVIVTHRNIHDVVTNYRDRVDVSHNSTSDGIVDLALTDTSPERAADILNEIVAVYNENTIRERQTSIIQTSEYINDRIKQLDAELGAKEAQISNFKRDKQILNVDDYGQAYLEASISSSEEINRINAQISHARYLKTFTEKNTENMLFPMTVDIEDENILSTIAEFNTLVLKLDKYKQTGTTNNPLVQSMQTELSTLKSNLGQLLTSYIGALQQKISSVEDIGRKAQEKIRSIPADQLYLDNISRVQGIKEGLYLTLLTRREELLISQPSIEGKASVIDRARVNPVPVSPNTRRSILLGVILGLLIPVAYFFLKRMLDTKIRFRKDIENYVDVPILAEIPAKGRKDTRKIVVEDKSRDAISEAFRILRSNLAYTNKADGSATSYLFLSLMEGSGKTFLTSNLAVSLAMVKKKVILLDLDLRKGTLTRNMDMRRHSGFSTYLSGKTDDIDSIIRHDAMAPGVDVILSGPIPPNPAELLSSSRLDKLFESLRSRYEYILIDAVPSGIVADATILKRFADVSVLVLRSGRVDKRMMPDIQAIKDRADFPNVTIILNGVDYKKQSTYYGRYGYGYGYGYGRGYGYGYGYGYGHQYGYGNEADVEEEEA